MTGPSTGPERLTEISERLKAAKRHGFVASCRAEVDLYQLGVLDTQYLLIRLTDQEHELISARAERDQWRETGRDVLDCLRRVLGDGSEPFTLSQRAEVQLAIEALYRALGPTKE